MAFFTKEKNGSRTSRKVMGNIVFSILTENSNDKNADLIKEKLESQMYSDEMQDLFEELMPIFDLSQKMHEISSTPGTKFANNLIDLHTIGSNYSTGDSLIDDVNTLNKKYHLIDCDIPYITEVEVMEGAESTDEILKHYGENLSDDENANYDRAHELLAHDWDKRITSWSHAVGNWYNKLNEKFNTEFAV